MSRPSWGCRDEGLHGDGSRFEVQTEVQNVRGSKLLQHERHMRTAGNSQHLFPESSTISSMYIPLCRNQSQAACTVICLGMSKACRNVEADKVQAGPGMLPSSLQQHPCFALAGGAGSLRLAHTWMSSSLPAE